eukprot:4952937-Pleurochrysis_carterae.AAC.1
MPSSVSSPSLQLECSQSCDGGVADGLTFALVPAPLLQMCGLRHACLRAHAHARLRSCVCAPLRDDGAWTGACPCVCSLSESACCVCVRAHTNAKWRARTSAI